MSHAYMHTNYLGEAGDYSKGSNGKWHQSLAQIGSWDKSSFPIPTHAFDIFMAFIAFDHNFQEAAGP